MHDGEHVFANSSDISPFLDSGRCINMPWPKKQVIQFDPDTDYRIFKGAVGFDRHLVHA